MLITSINNQTIKELDKLKQKKYRDLEQKFLIENLKFAKYQLKELNNTK